MTGFGSVKEVLVNPLNPNEVEGLEVSRYLKEADAYDNSATMPFCEDTEQNICVDNQKTKDTACKGDSGEARWIF